MSWMNNCLMNKKGTNMLDFIRIGLILVTTFAVILIPRAAGEINLKNYAAEQMVLDRLLFNSISGFSYFDKNGKVHPGIIDMSKFHQETLDASLSLPKRAGVKISVRSLDGSISKDISLNEDYAMLASGSFSGYEKRISIEPVVLRTDDGDVPGILEATYVFKKD